MSEIDGGLNSEFRKYLLPLGFFLQRIETGITAQGVPDLHYLSGSGVPGWIELKLETAVGVVHLRPEQIGWLLRYTGQGGRALVAVRLRHAGGPRKGDPTDELWLMDGQWAREIRRRGLSDSAPWTLGRWFGGPTGWRWDAVAEILSAVSADPVRARPRGGPG